MVSRMVGNAKNRLFRLLGYTDRALIIRLNGAVDPTRKKVINISVARVRPLMYKCLQIGLIIPNRDVVSEEVSVSSLKIILSQC